MSSFGYNETAAYEQFPLTKEDALVQGFKWEDTPRGTYGKETVKWSDFPDSIKDLADDFDVTKEVFVCNECNKNYRIIGNELIFYKKHSIPIPHSCFYCRNSARFKMENSLKLWNRVCMCDLDGHKHTGKCANEFETTYAPGRPEKIFCEDCYLKEVV